MAVCPHPEDSIAVYMAADGKAIECTVCLDILEVVPYADLDPSMPSQEEDSTW